MSAAIPFQLDTARLVLRKLQPADAVAWHAIRVHPAVMRFQPWTMHGVEEALAIIAAQQPLAIDTPNTWLQLGILHRTTGALLGDVGIHFPEDTRQVELGITLAPDEQGHGYAAEALAAVMAYLFSVLSKHRLYATTDPENVRCIALLRGLGMRQEGHLRESYWFRDHWADDMVFGILDHEWRARHPAASAAAER